MQIENEHESSVKYFDVGSILNIDFDAAFKILDEIKNVNGNYFINNKKFSTLYEETSNEYKEIVGSSFIEESALNNISKIQSELGNFTNGRTV